METSYQKVKAFYCIKTRDVECRCVWQKERRIKTETYNDRGRKVWRSFWRFGGCENHTLYVEEMAV